jgi:rhomboid protease GluP
MTDNRQSQGGHPLYDAPPPPDPQPDREQKKRRSIPLPGVLNTSYLTYALVVINVVLFLLRYIDIDLAVQLVRWGVADVRAIVEGDYYRLFSAMFLHANEAHIFFNMIGLYYIGTNVERIFGRTRFLLIYFLGGLAGSVMMMFSGTGGLGASGAVFAIFAAEAVYFWLNRDIHGDMADQRLRAAGLLIVFNFALGFIANISADLSQAENAVRISNAAHFGGLAGGAILAYFIAPRYRIEYQGNIADIRLLQTSDVHIKRLNPLDENWLYVLGFVVGIASLLGLALLLQGA